MDSKTRADWVIRLNKYSFSKCVDAYAKSEGIPRKLAYGRLYHIRNSMFTNNQLHISDYTDDLKDFVISMLFDSLERQEKKSTKFYFIQSDIINYGIKAVVGEWAFVWYKKFIEDKLLNPFDFLEDLESSKKFNMPDEYLYGIAFYVIVSIDIESSGLIINPEYMKFINKYKKKFMQKTE